MNTRYFKVILIPDPNGKVRELRVPFFLSALVLFLLAVSAVALAWIVADYAMMKVKIPIIARLNEENERQKLELIRMSQNVISVLHELDELRAIDSGEEVLHNLARNFNGIQSGLKSDDNPTGCRCIVSGHRATARHPGSAQPDAAQAADVPHRRRAGLRDRDHDPRGAWSEATGEAVVEPAKLSTLGHVQVFAKDAAADEGGEVSFIAPQNNYRLIDEPQRVIETVLRDEPRLSTGLRRLMVGALLSSGDVSMEGLLIGIDARARSSVYPALELREGRFFEPGEKGILINRGVARKLGARPGDAVVALGTTADGRLAGVKLSVTGVWMVRGLDAYEWGSCFASLEAVQELLDAGDAA